MIRGLDINDAAECEEFEGGSVANVMKAIFVLYCIQLIRAEFSKSWKLQQIAIRPSSISIPVQKFP